VPYNHDNSAYTETIGGEYPSTFTNENGELIQELMSIEVPEDKANDYTQYCVAVNQISQSPDKFSGDCMICRSQHSFDNCPVLKDSEFLRSHYIKFCQLMRRNLSAINRQRESRSSANVNFVGQTRTVYRQEDGYASDAEVNNTAAVGYADWDTSDQLAQFLGEDPNETPDFQRGTRWS
jgi:hypothetical protein